MSQMLNIYEELDDDALRGVLMEVLKVLPGSRQLSIDFLRRRCDAGLRRTMSLSDISTRLSGDDDNPYRISIPVTKKLSSHPASSYQSFSKGKGNNLKIKVKTSGCRLHLHNYNKPARCIVCSEVPAGVVRQAYHCRGCLIDVCRGCVGDLPNFVPICPGASSNIKEKRSLKNFTLGRKALKEKREKYRPTASSKLSIVQRKRAATNWGGQQKTMGTAKLSGSGGTDDTYIDPTYIQHLKIERMTKSGISFSRTPSGDSGDGGGSRGSSAEEGMYSNSQEAGFGDAVEEDSGDTSYDEDNSSDEGSEINSSDEDYSDDAASDTTGVNFGSRAFPGIAEEASSHDTATVAIDGSDEPNEGMFTRRTRTGAAADWTKHSASFRQRITNSKKMSPAALSIFLADPTRLEKEFDDIPENKVQLTTMPRLTETKNRYMNILPNNHSRVVLDQIGDDESSSYINANYMEGWGGIHEAFIACQGPLPETCVCFWRMIWQSDSAVIVMITNLIEAGKEKCERYWPVVPGEVVTYGEVAVVAQEAIRVAPQFWRTPITISKGGHNRSINHLWWVDWPDKGAPETCNGMGAFIREAHKWNDAAGPKPFDPSRLPASMRLPNRASEFAVPGESREQRPIVVHCSAGVGRTGCFLTIEYCMTEFDKTGHVDILKRVCRLRQSRGLTVQTAVQYRFIHEALQRHTKGLLFKDISEKELKKAEKKRQQTLKKSQRPDSVKDESAAAVAQRPLVSMFVRKPSAMGVSRLFGKRRSSEQMDVPRRLSSFETSEKNVLGHSLKIKTYVRPTQCSVCNILMNGLANQGYRCTVCKVDIGASCFERCCKNLPATCTHKTAVGRQGSGLPNWPPSKPEKRGGSKPSLAPTPEQV